MRISLLLTCISAVFSVSMTAQAPAAPQMARLYAYEVPADTAAEFFDVQRDTAEIYKANKAPHPRLCWTSLTGPQMFYMWVPIKGLDTLMDKTWLSQQGEELPRSARVSRLARASGRSEIKITASVPELTWNDSPNSSPDAYASVRVDHVRPGRVADYTAMMKDVVQTYKQMGKAKRYITSRVSYGGNVYEFHNYVGYANLGDTSSTEEFRKAMGEAKYAALIKKLGEVVDSSQRNLVRFRPEFSYVPEAK
ncbi:MAG: hypothetical protein ABI972_22795 [Acidobacteriota bacterium]